MLKFDWHVCHFILNTKEGILHSRVNMEPLAAAIRLYHLPKQHKTVTATTVHPNLVILVAVESCLVSEQHQGLVIIIRVLVWTPSSLRPEIWLQLKPQSKRHQHLGRKYWWELSLHLHQDSLLHHLDWELLDRRVIMMVALLVLTCLLFSLSLFTHQVTVLNANLRCDLLNTAVFYTFMTMVQKSSRS